MRRPPSRAPTLTLVLALLVPVPAAAQGFGVSLKAGTTGFGADLAVAPHPRVGLRAGAGFFPFDLTFTSSGVDYTLSLPSPQFPLLLDLYPAGSFRLTAGVLVSADDFTLDAELAESVQIGPTTYSPEELGNLTGTFDTKTISPYVGLGFGSVARRGVGFFLDLGVAFHGTPVVTAEADGPVTQLPGFQEDLDREVQEIQDDVNSFKVYPVVAVGVMIGIGR